MRTLREISSGGVVYRELNGTTEVALIRVGHRWCLPKGQVEKGEELQETALREVKEETGLDGEVVAKIGDISYWFTGKDKNADSVKIFKRVYFYLIHYLGGDVSQHDQEVEEVCWSPISEAAKRLSYPTERQTMTKAVALLKEQPWKRHQITLGMNLLNPWKT